MPHTPPPDSTDSIPGIPPFAEIPFPLPSGAAVLGRLPGSLRRLGQMTGRTDPEGLPVNDTDHVGVKGVDMGIPVEHDDVLHILFGDAIDAGNDNADPIGTTCATAVSSGVFPLDITARSGNPRFRFLAVPALGGPGGVLGADQTPTGGFSWGGRLYAFVVAPGGAFLTSTAEPSDPDGSYSLHYRVSPWKFLQIAAAVVDNAQIPRLPQSTGAGLLMWGVAIDGAVYLAWSPLGAEPPVAASRSTAQGMPLWYYAGGEQWVHGTGDDEGAATPVTAMPYSNQISVTWVPQIGQWLMVYSQANWGTQGADAELFPYLPIVFRTGILPWDWSDEALLADPEDGAHGRYMWDPRGGNSPGLTALPTLVGRPNDPGYFYGVYLLSRFTRYDAGSQTLTVYFLASTGHPYQVMLFTAQLRAGLDWRGWLRMISGPSSAPSHLPGYSTFAAGVAPVAVVPDADHLWLFAMGNEGRIWVDVRTGKDSVRWSNWFVLRDDPVAPGNSTFRKTLPPAVAVRDATHLDVMVLGNEDSPGVWYKQIVVGAAPNWWLRLPDAGSPLNPTTGPAAAARTAGATDVFAVGTDSRIWCITLTNGSPGAWTLLSDNYQDPNVSTFSKAAPPAAAARDDLATELFATGNDHGIWHKTVVRGQNSGGSSAWYPIPGGGRFGTGLPPAAVQRKAGVVDAFAVDGDGVVWWCVVTAGIPGSWQSIGGTFKASVAPSAVCRDTGHIEVFAVGNDDRIWNKTIANGVPTLGWGVVSDNPPAPALNRFSSVPVAAVAAGRWQLDVFAMAADGRIRRNYRTVRSSGLEL